MGNPLSGESWIKAIDQHLFFSFIRRLKIGQGVPGECHRVGHLGVAIEYEPIAELLVDRISAEASNGSSLDLSMTHFRRGREEALGGSKIECPDEGVYLDREHWDASIGSQWMATLARVLRIRGMDMVEPFSLLQRRLRQDSMRIQDPISASTCRPEETRCRNHIENPRLMTQFGKTFRTMSY